MTSSGRAVTGGCELDRNSDRMLARLDSVKFCFGVIHKSIQDGSRDLTRKVPQTDFFVSGITV